ncbi:hypothetical protein ACFC18_41370, partial [Streptomyces sp. NPDC056121]
GRGRMQAFDRNWKVCSQTPATDPGSGWGRSVRETGTTLLVRTGITRTADGHVIFFPDDARELNLLQAAALRHPQPEAVTAAGARRRI